MGFHANERRKRFEPGNAGAAIPFQLSRFEAPSLRRGTGGRFSDGMRKLYYDTVLYTEDASAC